MNLSWLKWVAIVAVVVGVGFIFTSAGTSFVYNRATGDTPGVNATTDKSHEAMLSKYAGFLMATFRYSDAKKFYMAAIQRYPAGANRYWNRYQLARAHEKLDENKEAAELLLYLWEEDAIQYDARVANKNELKLRIEKLIEVNDLDMDPFGER
jgi:hypothetical protein